MPEPDSVPPRGIKSIGAAALVAADVGAKAEAPAPVPPTPKQQEVPLSEEALVELEFPPASPIAQPLPVSAEATIRGWFADSFNRHLAGMHLRPIDLEDYLTDLLRRLGLRG